MCVKNVEPTLIALVYFKKKILEKQMIYLGTRAAQHFGQHI